MDNGALLGLVALLLVKEAGVPIPIPGDLLVLTAGVAAAANGATAPLALVAILAAGYLGGSVQFLLVRGALRGPLLAILGRVGVSRERLDGLAAWLRSRGARGVAVARVTPGLRIGAISASGLAALPFPAFLVGLVAGNSVFVGGHFALGFIVGAPALELIRGAGGPAIVIVGLVVLAGVGAAGWLWLRRRRPGSASRVGVTGLPSAGAWTEAACPACLAISLVGGLRDEAAVSGSA
jgi:membrane protein DedA with SNARE-associated domain